MIVNAALPIVTSALGTTYYLACGTSTTAAAKANTALGAEITTLGLARAAATVTAATTTVANDTLSCAKTFTATGAVSVYEVGLFNASSGPTMIGRTVLTTPRTFATNDQYVLIYQWVFQN